MAITGLGTVSSIGIGVTAFVDSLRAGALQLAALLALWGGEPAEQDRLGIVTSAGPDGNVGCLVVRRPVSRSRSEASGSGPHR